MKNNEFLIEWASEIHQNDVNSFLSRRGLPCLPSFSGTNPEGWIDGCEEYFEIHQEVEVYQYSLLAGLLVGKAKVWFSSWSLGGNEEAGLDEFLHALREHFRNEDEQKVHEEEVAVVEAAVNRECLTKPSAVHVTCPYKSDVISTGLDDLRLYSKEKLPEVDLDDNGTREGLCRVKHEVFEAGFTQECTEKVVSLNECIKQPRDPGKIRSKAELDEKGWAWINISEQFFQYHCTLGLASYMASYSGITLWQPPWCWQYHRWRNFIVPIGFTARGRAVFPRRGEMLCGEYPTSLKMKSS